MRDVKRPVDDEPAWETWFDEEDHDRHEDTSLSLALTTREIVIACVAALLVLAILWWL